MQIDARGNDIDARGIDAPPAASACPECGTALRTDGTGQPPVYCGRGCSSKAYRRRRQEAQGAVLAAAADTTRDESALAHHAQAAQIAALGAAVERTARRLAESLATSTGATGAMGDRIALSALGHAVDSLLLQARRAVETAARPASEVAPPAGLDAPRVETAAAAASLDSSRVETTGRLDGSRVETPSRVTLTPQADPVRPGVAGPAVGVPSASALPGPFLDAPRVESPALVDTSRVETAAPDAGLDASRVETAPTPGEASGPAAAPSPIVDLELQLVSPDRRGLGPATEQVPLPELGPSWSLAGWVDLPSCHLVLDEGRYVGWVEHGVGGTDRWIAVCGDGYLVDHVTGQPLWHATAPLAARTVKQALLNP